MSIAFIYIYMYTQTEAMSFVHVIPCNGCMPIRMVLRKQRNDNNTK